MFYSHADDKIFLHVEPEGYLKNSRLIKDALNRGKILAVDMNTNKLYLVSAPLLKEKKIYWWVKRGEKSRKLSNDYRIAMIQMADEFAIGRSIGRLYVDGILKYKSEFGDTDDFDDVLKVLKEVCTK